MNFHNIAVFDLETDGKEPSVCDPVEIAAAIIHPRTLQIIKNSEFHTFVRPLQVDDEDYYDVHRETIEWHANNQGCTGKEILERWKNAPSQKMAWKNFVNYLGRYHTQQHSRTFFTAPIAAGYNIVDFDLPIVKRLCQKYGQLNSKGEPTLFYPRDKIDAIDLVFYWFENSKELQSYDMDTLRKFFGLDSKGSHSADKDVYDTTRIIIRMMNLSRRFSSRIKFKDAFKELIDD